MLNKLLTCTKEEINKLHNSKLNKIPFIGKYIKSRKLKVIAKITAKEVDAQLSKQNKEHPELLSLFTDTEEVKWGDKLYFDLSKNETNK